MIQKLIFKTEEETESFGEELAKSLKPGTVIALTGDLGTGKTTLSKAIAKGLGVKERLSSPTFTVVMEYESGRLPLYHFDVYRVNDEEELFELGFEEYMHKGGICLIEWADLLAEGLLPADAISIHLAYGDDESGRVCEIEQ